MEETLALLAMTPSGPGPSLIKTYNAQNAALVHVTSTHNIAPTPICSVAGVVVAAGQKVIVHASVGYAFNGDSSSSQAVATIISEDGTPIDEVDDYYLPVDVAGAVSHTVTRVFEITQQRVRTRSHWVQRTSAWAATSLPSRSSAQAPAISPEASSWSKS
jgi:hypothetical protein